MKPETRTKALALLALVALVAVGYGLRNSFFSRSHAGHEGEVSQAAVAATEWTCSMHPQVRQPGPGTCPICSMKLIPVKSVTAVVLTPDEMKAANVETAVVRRGALVREIRAFGRIEYDERTLQSVTVRADGYVEKLIADYTGKEVKRGEPLCEVFSPDLSAAQEEYLLVAGGDSNLKKAAADKLLRLGLLPEQVDSLKKSGKTGKSTVVLAPADGTIVEKNAVQGAAFKMGDALYRLADLDQVWLVVEVAESDLPLVKADMPVTVSAESLPGEVFTGKVLFVKPLVEESTRTTRLPVVIGNKDRKLKPGMFVNAILSVSLEGITPGAAEAGKYICTMCPSVISDKPGSCPICNMALVKTTDGNSSPIDRAPLIIPVSAVLDTGARKIVYRQSATNQFEAVVVTVGPKAENFYPVLTGLREGDSIAIRGNFLLDSQSQISGLPSLLNEPGEK